MCQNLTWTFPLLSLWAPKCPHYSDDSYIQSQSSTGKKALKSIKDFLR